MFQNEVALLKRVEARIEKDRNQSHGHSGSWGRSSWGATMSNGESLRDLPDDPLRRACRSPLRRLLLSLGTNQTKTMHIKLSSKQLDSDTGYDGQDGRDGPTKGEHDECSALVRRPSSLVQ